MNMAIIILSAVAALCAGVSAALWLAGGTRQGRFLFASNVLVFACNLAVVIIRLSHA